MNGTAYMALKDLAEKMFNALMTGLSGADAEHTALLKDIVDSVMEFINGPR